MTDLLDLIDAAARTTDPQTSHAAAASVNVTKQAQQVLRLLAAIGRPALDEELVDLAGRVGVKASPSGIRSRRATLVSIGLVEPVDTAQMSTGRMGTRHQLTARGRQLLAELPQAAA